MAPPTRAIFPYTLIVTGPQHISVETATQANGLNFSRRHLRRVFISC